MNETVLNLLQSISDTRGFIMFCLVMAVAYASVWTLFLFEAPPKKKKNLFEMLFGTKEEARARRKRNQQNNN